MTKKKFIIDETQIEYLQDIKNITNKICEEFKPKERCINYICNTCNYHTHIISSYKKHLFTIKHQKLTSWIYH